MNNYNFVASCAGIALKLENFYKFHSTTIPAILCNRRQETVSMPQYSLK